MASGAETETGEIIWSRAMLSENPVCCMFAEAFEADLGPLRSTSVPSDVFLQCIKRVNGILATRALLGNFALILGLLVAVVALVLVMVGLAVPLQGLASTAYDCAPETTRCLKLEPLFFVSLFQPADLFHHLVFFTIFYLLKNRFYLLLLV